MEPSTDGKKLRRRRVRWADLGEGPPGLHPLPGEKEDSKVHDSLEGILVIGLEFEAAEKNQCITKDIPPQYKYLFIKTLKIIIIL